MLFYLKENGTAMVNEVYVVGEESRLVVKNFLQELRAAGCDPKVIFPDPAEIQALPAKEIHLIVCLEDKMDFRIIRDIAEKQKQSGYFLYFVGNMTLDIEDEQFMKQLSCVRFSSYTLDVEKLTKLLEKNDVAKKRILVVDDEPIFLRSIKGWLNEDFEVFLVNSGEMAMEFLDMHPVDLVLLDYKMPTMDGPTVLSRIRDDKNLQDLPVIFLTANNSRESIMSVMQLKPNGYILKTMEPDEIKKSVQDFFKNRVMIFS